MARSLLESSVSEGERDAQVYLGTVLSLSPYVDWYREGVELLRELAERGNALATHNLVTALTSGVGATDETRSECARFVQIAGDNGSSDNGSSDNGSPDNGSSEDEGRC